MSPEERAALIAGRVFHGDLDKGRRAWCAECGARVGVTHFDFEAYAEAHPRALQGISARDLTEFQRRTGDGLRRVARWLLERRDRDIRALAVELQAAGGGWTKELEEEIERRTNAITLRVKGRMNGAGQPVLSPKGVT